LVDIGGCVDFGKNVAERSKHGGIISLWAVGLGLWAVG
jgi:hypothetical protein